MHLQDSMDILPGRSLRNRHERLISFLDVYLLLQGGAVEDWGRRRVYESNNILRKNLVPTQLSFPCFSQDYVLFCHGVQNKV